MKSVRSTAIVSVSVCLVLLVLSYNAYGAAEGFLTGVETARDQKRIVIRYEGEIGKHAAFVMEQPYRLVVDFSSTALGRVPRKIGVNGSEIREIRLGETPERARLVLDFGENTVPAFRIQRMDGAVLVMLGGGAGSGNSPGLRESAGRTREAPSVQASKRVREAARSRTSSPMVKRAGIEDDQVYVELVDKNNGGKTYRLVVDCNFGKLAVRQASLSDETGTLKRFDLSESSAVRNDTQKGPGRYKDARRPIVRPKFHWGKPVVQVREPDEDREKQRGPFKLEELKLKVRNQDT
ncbi:MAG: AMIN domain-containing protein [Desulfomonilaceae bacterium]|nr:AMIN domain-containing protein [Desulfomonilaceae bacterium]